MNPVLDVLCSDHANFGKLLNVIEQQAEAMSSGTGADITILAQAVAYLESYPTLYHHPLEDAVYWRLRAVRPDKAADVAAILYEHASIRQLLTRFKQTLTHYNAADPATITRLAAAAFAFVDTQWLHMEYERSGLFAAAAENLSAQDWQDLMEDMPRPVDALFSAHITIPALRELHSQLLTCDNTRDASLALRMQRHAATAAPASTTVH